MTTNANKIAIIGRPNVGKSALFNRIMGRRVAIVDKTPGITRDRLGLEAEWMDKKFILLDTGGIGIGSEEPLADQVHLQADIAIEEAVVILLVVDVTDGIVALDREVADLVRVVADKVLIVVNKCDNQTLMQEAAAFHELGFAQVFPVSAVHAIGVGEMMDVAVSLLPEGEFDEAEEQPVAKIAMVGKPNAGKSTLVNALLNENRLVVDSVPGTTRDSVDVLYRNPKGETFMLIDTAGIKRKRNIKEAVEKYSLMRSEEAINRCDVVVMMIDAEAGISSTDSRIAHMIVAAGKSCVIAVNKWDLMQEYNQGDYRRMVYDRMRFLDYAPVIFISAGTGKNVGKTMRTAHFVFHEGRGKISTPELNQIIQEAQERHQPPLVRGRRLKIYYATQVSLAPARFLIFVNDPTLLKSSYLNYLENRIREKHPCTGVPMNFNLRRRKK